MGLSSVLVDHLQTALSGYWFGKEGLVMVPEDFRSAEQSEKDKYHGQFSIIAIFLFVELEGHLHIC